MKNLLFIALAVSSSVFAQMDAHPFKNVREGVSIYSKKTQVSKMEKALRLVPKEQIIQGFEDSIQNNESLCDYKVRDDFYSALKKEHKKINFTGAVYALRSTDEIDDVVAKILLNADEVLTTSINSDKNEEHLYVPRDEKVFKEQILKLRTFQTSIKQKCLDEAYSSYVAEQQKLDKKISGYELESIHYWGLKSKIISENTYELLEKARINKLNQKSLSLASYKQKLKFLRTQFPLRDETERSTFATKKVKKMDSSRRQKLYENYSDFQIVLMGKVVEKLRHRLEYDNVEIQGFQNGVLQEVIPLEPMERFRFAIRALRKEMTLLATNSYFNGRSPEYLDLMMASYEIGLIPASELDEVAGLEEIWNPKKTFWDKASVWVRLFSSVATIVIPPPYGFIPALVLVVIEASVGEKKDPNVIDPSVLF